MEETEIIILKKLKIKRVWGSKHLRLETILKSGWEPHEKGLVKKAIKSLIKKEYLLWAKKEKKALQLNKEKAKEIFSLIYKEKITWEENQLSLLQRLKNKKYK